MSYRCVFCIFVFLPSFHVACDFFTNISLCSNVALQLAMHWLVTFEGHRTVSQFQKALAFKVSVEFCFACAAIDASHICFLQVFLSMFLNTACIVLLINAAMPATVASISIGGLKIFTGQYSGFNVAWHVSVGAGIVLTMVCGGWRCIYCKTVIPTIFLLHYSLSTLSHHNYTTSTLCW